MSHYTYKRKKFVSISDRRIMPLTLIADSSVWNEKRSSHPAHWALLLSDHILFTLSEMEEAKKKKYEEEANLIERAGICPKKAITPETSLYSGDVYLFGRKFKNMTFFYSTRKSIHFDSFIVQFPNFSLTFEVYDAETYAKVANDVVLAIKAEDDLIRAEELFQELRRQYKDKLVCVRVGGMD